MALLSVDQYSERQRRSLHRIKEMMAAASTRSAAQYQRVRQHQRKEFQGIVFIRLPHPDESEVVDSESPVFQAWAYDISQGGIAFVTPDSIPQEDVMIGLKRPDGSLRWMPGRIVRSREIPQEDFLEYGVAFQRAAI